jgi:hypothetical protein
MTKDPILEEVRSIRDGLAREHDYDVRAIVAALQQEEAGSGQQVVVLPPKRIAAEKPRVRKAG